MDPGAGKRWTWQERAARRKRLARLVERIVAKRPGISFLRLRQACNTDLGQEISMGDFFRSLARFEQEGRLVSRRWGRTRRYFAPGAERSPDWIRISLLAQPRAAEFARLVLRHPGASQTDLLGWIDPQRPMKRTAASYHLSRLVAHGLVQVRKDQTRSRYTATRSLSRLLRLAEQADRT